MRWRVPFVAGAIIVAIAATASADDAPTMKQWGKRADRVCAARGPGIDRHLSRGNDALHAANYVEAGVHFRAGARRLRVALRRIDALPRPTVGGEVIWYWLSSKGEALRALERAARALRQGKLGIASLHIDDVNYWEKDADRERKRLPLRICA